MKIAMNMLVRNEADIIERNIRYHSSLGVDSFLVMDHLSTDRTPQILESLSKEFDLTVVHQDNPAYLQAQWMTGMGVAAAMAGADWIINNDADEFWWCESDLKEYLGRIPQDVDSLQCYWRTVAPCRDFPNYAENPMVKTDDTLYKTMMRPHEGISVSIGNHWVYSSKKPWQMYGVKVYHFTDRSPSALYNKYVVGHESLVLADLPEHCGGHWRGGNGLIRDTSFESFRDSIYLSKEELIAKGNIVEDRTMVDLLANIKQEFPI